MLKGILLNPKFRRAFAAGVVVFSAGGLVLARSTASAHLLRHDTGIVRTDDSVAGNVGASENKGDFAGPGAHGSVALSHKAVRSGAHNALFADVRLVADAAEKAAVRAPLAMAIVLDTSGSMQGEKIERAKDAVLGLVHDMRDDDEIAIVHYSDEAEVVQDLAPLGRVRETIGARVRALRADGGTAIPRGLDRGLKSLAEVSGGRVRRVVLVSDGLDSTRAQAEHLARSSFERGVTISSLGIGLDFDASYMGSVAECGHGNFGFVNDGAALASFLHRELDETAQTTVENATVRVTLPAGVTFVRATGADARAIGGGEVELKLGSLFAGDERRAVLELETDLAPSDTRALTAHASWQRVGGGLADVTLPTLQVVATNDAAKVLAERDTGVLARVMSVVASRRQVEAAEAYSEGNVGRAHSLIQQNMADLKAAATAAPEPVAKALGVQMQSYEAADTAFAAVPPSSPMGKVAAKQVVAKDFANAARSSY